MSLCVAITDSNIQCGHQRELWCISRQMLRTIISLLLRHWVHENVRSTRHNMQRKISILLKHIFMQIMVYTNFVFSTLYFYFAQPHFSFFPIGSGKLYLNYKCCDIVMTWTDVVMYCCHLRLGYEKQCLYIYIYISSSAMIFSTSCDNDKSFSLIVWWETYVSTVLGKSMRIKIMAFIWEGCLVSSLWYCRHLFCDDQEAV